MNTLFEKARCEGQEPDWLVYRTHEMPGSILKVVYAGKGKPCFVIAPAGFGKTSFACAYARRFHSLLRTFWFSGDDPSFDALLVPGTIEELLEEGSEWGEGGLVVIDDLPQLPPDSAQVLSDGIDALIAAGWEVLVLHVPSHDCLSHLQEDRQLVLGRHLAAGVEDWTEEERLYCIQRFFQEPLPHEYFRTALCLLLMQDGEMDDLRSLDPTIQDQAVRFLATYYPFFGISARRNGFKTWPVSPEHLKEPAQRHLIEGGDLDFLTDRDLSRGGEPGELRMLSEIAGMLLKKGESHRAYQVLELGHADYDLAEDWEPLDTADPDTVSVPAPAPPTGGFDLMGRTKRFGTAFRSASSFPQVKVGDTLFPPLDAKLFGGLEVRVGDRLVLEKDWRKAKAKSLFAHLLLGFGNEVPRSQLISSLWPDMDGASSLNNFYSVWSYMKGALEDDQKRCPYVVKVGSKCKVLGDLVHSDVERFEELSRQMVFHNGDTQELLNIYREMEVLYTGALFTGDIRDTVLEGTGNRYRSLMANNMMAASDWFMQVGDTGTTLWFAWKAYDVDPGREDVCRNLMRAQALAGQRTAAMETFFNLRTYLADELGVHPSRQTVLLFESLVSEKDGVPAVPES